jgi:hypothetical protein
VIPTNAGGDYVVAEIANWLWQRLIADNGKNLDIVARSQIYALLARGDDFGYVAVSEGAWPDRGHAFTSDELNNVTSLANLLAQLGQETLPLASTDIKGARKTANARVGQAVQFIAMLPYTFVVEGQ